MKMPWASKTGLAKAASIFSTGLLLSLGLCGVNFLFVITAGDRAGMVPTYLGIFELAGMILCAIGLLVVGMVTLFQGISHRFSRNKSSEEDEE